MTVMTAMLAMFGCSSPVLHAQQEETPPPPGKDISVYFLGNSLTRCIPVERLADLFKAAGGELDYGIQLGGGHHLQQHLSMRNWGNKPGEGEYNIVKKYGPWPQAFTEHKFDAIVLQPYMNVLDAPEKVHKRWPWWTAGSLQAASGLITAARGQVKPGEGWYRENYKSDHVASDRFYVYAVWPPVGEVLAQQGEKTYANYWDSEYAGEVQHCADFFAKMVQGLNERHPDLPVPVRMIPSGHVMAALDVKIRNDELPGIEDFFERNMAYFVEARNDGKKKPAFNPKEFVREAGILNVYADGVHMNDQPHNGRKSGTIGSYITALTHYATLTGQNPVGLTVDPYEQFDAEKDAELVKAIQETVWEVVTVNPHTDVKGD